MDTPKTLREYPHLPVLSKRQVSAVLASANMNAATAARWIGCSRAAMGRWLNLSPGRLNPTSEEAVSTLAYRVLRALKYGHYPIPYERSRLRDPLPALKDENYDKPLSEYRPQELLPDSWLAQFNLRDHDATV